MLVCWHSGWEDGDWFYVLLICLSSIRGNATSGEEPGSAGLLAARQESFFFKWIRGVVISGEEPDRTRCL